MDGKEETVPGERAHPPRIDFENRNDPLPLDESQLSDELVSDIGLVLLGWGDSEDRQEREDEEKKKKGKTDFQSELLREEVQKTGPCVLNSRSADF